MMKRLRREEGAAAVEFALIVGVLSLLLFGMMEYGLFFLQSQSLRSGAREGARFAAVRADLSTIQQHVVDGSAGSLPSGFSGVTVSVNGSVVSGSGPYCTDQTAGQEVQVDIPTGSGGAYPAALPSGVVQSFQIDIPFMPHLDLHPTISGTFRCE